ncbi:hypothetical protein BH10BAC6_BH10BAC6_06200 [soil metagenome]
MRLSFGLSTLMLALVIMSCSSVTTFSDAQRAKCNAPLLMITDRYRDADVDTTFTVAIQLTASPTAAMQQQMKDCGATISSTSSTILFVRTASQSIPCLSSIESVIRLEYTPLTTPTL